MNDLQVVPSTPAEFEASITGEYIPFEVPRKHIDRETWLNQAAVIMIAEKFDTLEYLQGYIWPVKYRISVGHVPGARINSSVLGCAIQSIASATNHNEIFIAPYCDDSSKILGILIHELIHASDDNASGHATHGHFGKVARGIGLEGPLTATTAGDELEVLFSQIIDALGPIPHGAINLSGQPDDTNPGKPGKAGGAGGFRPSTGGKKRGGGSRMIKSSCTACDFSYRASQKNLDMVQVKTCPACQAGEMV